MSFSYDGGETGLTVVIPATQLQNLDDQAVSDLTLTDGDNDGIYTAQYTIDNANSVSDGAKVLSATVTDGANNTYNPQVTVTLDNTPPVFVSLVSLDPDVIYANGETILLRATFDASGYTVTCDFSTIDSAYVSSAESIQDNGDGTYLIRYTLSEGNPRPNGNYTVQASATDGVGLTANGTIDLYLDNTGPVVSNLALADADDILNADDVITATVTDNDANIQGAEFFVDVIGEPGDGIPMTATDGNYDSQTESVTAALSIAGLSEGQHTLYVRGQDVTGKWGQVLSILFVVDRVAPLISSVAVHYPEDQTAARNGQNVTITAQILEVTTQLDPVTILLRSADVDANSAAGYVMVDDGTGGDAVAGDGIYTGTLTVTSDSTGSFAFTIDASDIVPNNRQISGSVVLDNTAPVFVSLVCLDPDTIYTNGETILLRATFDAAGYTVTCDFGAIDSAYVSGAEHVEDNGDGTYTIRYTLSEGNSRSNGSYTVIAVATDGVGLTASGTIDLYLDNTGPVVSNLALADADDILNADDVITATVTDNDANIQGAEFFIDVIGSPGEGTSMAATDGSFDSRIEDVTAVLSIANLSEGQHTLYVRGQDVTGKWGQVTSLIFIVDRLPPTIESVLVVYPNNQVAARQGQNIIISALIKEATTQLDSASIRLRAAEVDSNSSGGYVMVDDGTGGDAVAGDGIYTAVLNVTSDSTGSLGFTITASDIVPNTGQVRGSVVLDNTPPVFVSLLCLDPDMIYRNGETILLQAIFDTPNYTVTCDFIAIDDTYVEDSEDVENNGNSTYTIRYTISETNQKLNGSYTITATATDSVGLTATGTIVLQLVNTGPVVLNLELDDADDILNTDDVITATVTDNDANILRAEFYVDVIGIPGEGSPMAPVDGSFNSRSEAVTAVLPITYLSEGQHTLYVRGQNVSGEWGRLTTLIFIVDRVPPTIETVEIRYPEGQHAAKRGQPVVISALIKEATTRLDSMTILLKAVAVDVNSQSGYVMVDDGSFGDRIPGDGIFTATLTVTSGNTGFFGFTIEASDIVPNHHQIGGSILLDNMVPLMTVAFFPIPDNGEVYVDEIRVVCSYYDLPDSGEVRRIELVVTNTQNNDVNTSPIIIPTDEDKNFSRIVQLVPGENTITVTITDFAGNVTIDTSVLTYLHPVFTQDVDMGGGIVRSSDSTEVDIPSNALLSSQTITISVVSTKDLPGPMGNVKLIEVAHAFGPDGLVFHRPVTVTLTYNDAHLDIDQDGVSDFQEAELDVFFLDGNVWIKTKADARDMNNNTVTFTTNHFSVYALGNAEAPDDFRIYWTKNPFNPAEGTTAVMELTEPGRISLKVYDLSGDMIRTISDNESVDGTTSRRWDGLNDFDRFVGSGIYIYIFEYIDENGGKRLVRKPIGVVK